MFGRGWPSVAAIAIVSLAVVCAPGTALAGRRVALVVGNAAYQNLPQSKTTAEDARAVAQMFRDAGFDFVELEVDLSTRTFQRVVQDFDLIANGADVAVIYYSGHATAIHGTNFLPAVDTRPAGDVGATSWMIAHEAVSLDRLVESTDGAKSVRLVIVDASRTNPLIALTRKHMDVIPQGLSQVAAERTLVASSNKPGLVSEDGDGPHSPYTAALLKNLTAPGVDVRQALGRVRDEVLRSTGQRQEPFFYGGLEGSTLPLVPASPAPQPPN